MKYLTILLLYGIFLIPASLKSQNLPSSQPQKKIALAIGNGDYVSSMLSNPENDARSMKSALQEVGFTVTAYENLNQAQMKEIIDDFGAKLRGCDVGLFFYAGHGIQSKGYNYLIPVDAQLKTEEQVEYDCVRADRILSLMETSGTQVNIVILDACRNNPFERSWSRSGNGKGLAFMDAPKGTIIAYATAPGRLASDGIGNNGLYTSALLESLKIPNITIEKMFQNVRNIVAQKSQNQQIPWESTSLTGDFYFTFTPNNNASPNIHKDNFGQNSLGSTKSLITPKNTAILIDDIEGTWIAVWDKNAEIAFTITGKDSFTGKYTNIPGDGSFFKGSIYENKVEVKQYYRDGRLYGTYTFTNLTPTLLKGRLVDYTTSYNNVVWEKK